MRFFYVVIFLFTLCLSGLSQSSLDSLKHVASTTPDDTAKVRTYIRIYYEYHRNNLDSALLYAVKAENLARNLDFKIGLADALYRQSTLYRHQSKYFKAEQLLDQAVQYFVSLKDSTYLLYTKIDQGRLSQVQYQQEKAITYFQEAVELAKLIKDKNAQARAENYLGQIFKEQKQYEKASQHYGEALALVRQIDFKPGISAVLTNLAEICIEENENDLAFEYLDEALELKREMGDQLGVSRVLQSIASVHSNLSRFDDAMPFYEESYQIAKTLRRSDQQALATYGLANNNYELGQYEKALYYAKEATPFINESKNLSLAVSNLELQARIYNSLGENQKSINYYEQHSILVDSLYDQNKLALINELDEKYNSEQKAREIALLESENDLKSLQIERGETERNFLIAIVVVTFILIGLFYNQYRVKQRANQKLRELDRMKTTFFENLSHEFRTPLTLIMGPLREKLNKTDPKEKEDFEAILQNAENLLTLINELLDLAKIESGGYTLNKSSIEISHFAKVLSSSFDSFALSKSIEFEVKVPSKKEWLIVDQEVISKVCNNLLSNAFKFTPEHGKINLTVLYENGSLKIEVSDDGIGIAPKDRDRVFNRFEQVQSNENLSQGTGIGLALVRELTQAHGGEVSLKSYPGRGSTFLVTIPVKKGKPQSVAASELKSVRSSNGTTAEMDNALIKNDAEEKVLVIEDNDKLRRYISHLLSDSYQVLTASNGKEGISTAVEQIPDLVISDVMMPEMDGLELCEELNRKEETDHIPVILLTARADRQTKLSGLRSGALHYMIKPFEPEELKITVNNIIQQQKKLQQKYLSREASEVTTDIHPFIQKCEAIVQLHLDDHTFDMNQFAAEVGMSRMQLHRKLVSLTNLSATGFIRHLRLIEAKRLLETGENISQVAYAVGFSSLSYFSSSFKKEFGKSPTKYSSTL